jgi:hypothetical protein
MRRNLFAALAVCVLFAPRAAADEAAQAILDKAIQAAGGAENLTKYPASEWKGKGKFYGFGEGIEYTGVWSQFYPGRSKTVLDVEFNGMKIQNVRVVNGDKGWQVAMGSLQDLDKDQLYEALQGLHYDRVLTFVPLKDKGYTLTSLGESMVEKQPAVGIKVSHKDHRDIQLFFDKTSGQLLKGTIKVKDQMTGGQPVDQEMHYGGYKDFQGRQVATKVRIHREGKLYIENEITEYKRLEKLDEKVFGKPE